MYHMARLSLSRIFIIISLIVLMIIAVWFFFGIHNNTELVDRDSLIMRTPIKHHTTTYNLTDTIASDWNTDDKYE